jgi:hypothetical protein
MQLATTTLRRLAAAMLLACFFHAPAQACSCERAQADTSGFLHLDKEASIELPANALGVLYFKKQELKTRTTDKNGNEVLTEAPPKLMAREFIIRDLTVNRTLKAKLTRLDIDMQLGDPSPSYFLIRKGAMADEPAHVDDVRILADKHGLRDISAAVRDAAGLFRVAPVGGFIAGHTYSMTTERDGAVAGLDRAEVVIGPRLVNSEPDKFALLTNGSATRELLTLAGSASCSMKRAAIVQQLRYTIPAQREPYRHLLATFTRQQFFGADLTRFRAPAKVFVENDYRSEMCAAAPAFGASESGPGKDLVYASCPKMGGAPDRRQVRGYAGMLELEDTLHETAIVDIAFDKATGPGCWRLRMLEDGGSASALRGWFGD